MGREVSEEVLKTVVIARTDNIGDVILTLPLVHETGLAYPDARIIFLVRTGMYELLKHSPLRFETTEVDTPLSLQEIKRKISPLNADAVIIARPEYSLAKAFRSTGTPVRAGTAYRWYSYMFTHRVKEHRKFAEKHESEYNLGLLRAITGEENVHSLPERLLGYTVEEAKNFLHKEVSLGITPGTEYIVIHCGSRGSARDISSEQFRSLAGKLSMKYPGMKLIYTGTVHEKEKITASIPENCTACIDLCGELSLRELMILIDNSRLVVANSTGPAHIAGALNRNVLAFFPNSAPMNEVRWKPLGDHVSVMKPANVSDDMTLINTDTALEACTRLLGNSNNN
ncbi:MAG: glycosyltransferase family 9 protein [Ignavibacteria bacterium]|nr:glycosyltransferase family 9 protein [Ignavibacteria bacterium]